MSAWATPEVRVYDANDNIVYSTEAVISGRGSRAWHEVGRGSELTAPYGGTVDFTRYANGNRVYLTIVNTVTNTTHIIADFIIESGNLDEITTSNGGQAAVLRLAGRERIKELAEIPARRRCISKVRYGGTATAITSTTLQMNPTDTATYASMSLIGWTIELEDGNWSEIVDHTTGGLITIDPAWQVSMDGGPTPPVQKWSVYGAAFSETSGNYTDLKQVFYNLSSIGGGGSAQARLRGWGLHPQGYDSTATGSFVAVNEGSSLKALQLIAAQTGEYFVPVPGERRIHWRRTVPPTMHPQYGYVLSLQIPPSDIGFLYQNAYIKAGPKVRWDATEVYTRIRPSGAGSGDQALTLKDLPDAFSVASGHTLDGEYLVKTALETGGKQIVKDLRLDGIGPASDSDVSRQIAAEALYRAALLWLQEHEEERLIIECDIMSAVPISPVSYVNVHLPNYGIHNHLLYVLESTAIYADGELSYQVILSDKIAPVMDDERIVAEAIRQTDSEIFFTTAPQRNSRMMDRMGSFGGDSGTWHDPVTSGNPAIAVATGQVVSLALEPDSGLDIGDDGLMLGAPGPLSASSISTVSGDTHTHPVTAVSDAKTTPDELLKGDSNGDITLRQLTADKLIAPEVETASGDITLDPASGKTINDGHLEFTGARAIGSSGGGSLTIAPQGNLVLDAVTDAINIGASNTLKTDNWASGFLGTGWGVTYAGALDARSIYADAMRVMTFTSDVVRVRKGSLWISPTAGMLSREFTIPASVGNTETIYFEDTAGAVDTRIFDDNEWVLLHIVDRTGGQLTTGQAWGQVASYSDLVNDEQSYTFTLRSASAGLLGKKVQKNDEVLGFGYSGDGWIFLTTTDDAGSPYLGITQWQGSDPYTGGNRSHKLRLGQLQGVSGLHEWGLQAGQSTANFIRFSDIRSEIHGSRLSLYAGDGGQLRVTAARVIHYRAAGSSSNLTPNADHTVQGILSTGANCYTEVDENPGSPTTGDYLYNGTNQSGVVFLGLTNPTWTGITYQVNFSCHIIVTGLTNDEIRLYGQVFASDEMTPLTSEKLIYTATSNTAGTLQNVQCDQVFTNATQTQWNGARLRLRWEYAINASEEAIRLDPNVPSIAVGNPLPTGYQAGGAGFWAGWHGTAYGVRMGHPTGPNARWDGANFRIANDAGADVFYFPSSGEAYIASPVHLGAAGGIWQGTGSGASFAAPKSGWKLYNDGTDKGAFSAYNASGQKLVQIDHDGFHGYIPTTTTVAVHVRGTGVEFDNATAASTQTGLNWVTSSTTYSSIYGWKDGSAANLYAGVGSKASGLPAIMMLEAENNVDAKNASLILRGGDTDDDTYVLITPGARIAKGLVVGSTATVVNQGQIVADLAGAHDFNQLILQDTIDVAHNMTSLVATGTYGVLGKVTAGTGGLDVDGFSDDTVGLRLAGHGVNQSTTNATTSAGSITMDAAIRSGAGPNVTALGATGNVLAVRNNGLALILLKGNGDLHLNTTLTQNSFDEHADAELVRAVTLARNMRGVIRSKYDEWVRYNRADLEQLGLLDGPFINFTGMQELHSGAIWEHHRELYEIKDDLHETRERLSRLEAAVHG